MRFLVCSDDIAGTRRHGRLRHTERAPVTLRLRMLSLGCESSAACGQHCITNSILMSATGIFERGFTVAYGGWTKVEFGKHVSNPICNFHDIIFQ